MNGVSSLPETKTVEEDTWLQVKSMSIDALQAYAVSITERVKYLENALSSLENKTRQTDALQHRRHRQFHEFTTLREKQLRDDLNTLQFELAAEKSIRNDLEKITTHLRSLCKTAKDRLGLRKNEKEELELLNSRLLDDVEKLKTDLAESWFINNDLSKECHALREELQRERYRQCEFKTYLNKSHEVEALNIIVDLLRLLCKRIKNHSKSETDLKLLIKPNDLFHATSSPLSLLAESVFQLVITTLPHIPKTSISLKDISNLEFIASLCQPDSDSSTDSKKTLLSNLKLDYPCISFSAKRQHLNTDQSWGEVSCTASTTASSSRSSQIELDINETLDDIIDSKSTSILIGEDVVVPESNICLPLSNISEIKPSSTTRSYHINPSLSKHTQKKPIPLQRQINGTKKIRRTQHSNSCVKNQSNHSQFSSIASTPDPMLSHPYVNKMIPETTITHNISSKESKLKLHDISPIDLNQEIQQKISMVAVDTQELSTSIIGSSNRILRSSIVNRQASKT